jgi:hypothetical protein
MQPGAPGAMAPYGQPGMPGPMVGTMPSPGAAAVGPTRRNPVMTWLMPAIVMIGAVIVGVVLSLVLAAISTGLALIGTLVMLLGVLAGGVLALLSAKKMAEEIKAVTQNPAFNWWPVLIPGYNAYWALLIVPAEVTKAKQRLGVQAPTRGLVVYFFLWPFALASDINDMVR